MSLAPPRPCARPGCLNLVQEGYCRECKAKMNHNYNVYHREKAIKGMYDTRWRMARLAYLKRNPLCVECAKEGRLTVATEVDHIQPHGGDRRLFWDQGNWQALCKRHHSEKTARENWHNEKPQ